MTVPTRLFALLSWLQVVNMLEGQRHPRQQRQGSKPAAQAAISILLLLAWSHTAAAVLLSKRPGNVLTMILTDCAKYQDWQTVAAAFAWRQSGQPGSVIRVANCNEKDTKNYDKHMLDYVETHMAKQVRAAAVLRMNFAGVCCGVCAACSSQQPCAATGAARWGGIRAVAAVLAYSSIYSISMGVSAGRLQLMYTPSSGGMFAQWQALAASCSSHVRTMQEGASLLLLAASLQWTCTAALHDEPTLQPAGATAAA